jgi:hypothetical protein
VSTAGDLSTSSNLKVGSYNQKVTGLSGTDAGNYDFTGVISEGNYTVGGRDVTISAAGNTVIFNNNLQIDAVSDDGRFITGDKVGSIVGAGRGTQVGSYESSLSLTGDTSDLSNYNVTFKQASLTIGGVTPVPPGPVDPNINPVTPFVVPVGPKPVGPSSSSSGTFKTASVEDEGTCTTYLKGDQKVNKYALNIEVCQLGNKKDKKDKKDDKDIVS